MNMRPLFIVFFIAAWMVVPACGAVLDPFLSLQPADISAQQTAVEHILSQTDDPAILLQAGDLLRSRCVDPPINSLEYWGSDAEAEAALRGSSVVLLRLLDRTETLAHSQADAAASAMRGANDSSPLERWQHLTAEAQQASDDKITAAYARLLATELEQKETLADQAIALMKTSDLSDPKHQ
jgi:hypothetical protein